MGHPIHPTTTPPTTINVELRRPAPTPLRPANPTPTSIALGSKATPIRPNTLSEIQRENVGLFVSMLKVAKELQEAIPHTPSIVDPIKDEANRTVLSHNTT